MHSTDWCKNHRQKHGVILGGACDSCPHKVPCDQFIKCGLEIFSENRKRKKKDDQNDS